MNKQKQLIIILALAIGLMIGGTSAYYVTSERAHNTITTSGINITLIENTNAVDPSGEEVPFEDILNAIPGTTYSKIPEVRNDDEGSAWIRIHITRTATLADGSTVTIPASLLDCDLDLENWQGGAEDYYYYKRALTAGAITEPLFTHVKIEDNLDNIYNGATFSLKLTAQAVQAANNGDSALTAEGWPEE